MSGFREYEVDDAAIKDAKYYGLGGQAALRLKRMARRSAPCTDERGNRRFGDYILQIDDNRVTRVTRI